MTQQAYVSALKAYGLSEELPDVSSLMKPILVLDHGDGYRFRIGLELPFYDLKKIGAVPELSLRRGGERAADYGIVSVI